MSAAPETEDANPRLVTAPPPVTPDITIGTEDAPAPILVDLMGTHYYVRKPKAALLMRLAVSFQGVQSIEKDPQGAFALVNTFIEAAFGDNSDAVKDRLEDAKDALDYDNIATLMRALMAYKPPTDPLPADPSTSS